MNDGMTSDSLATDRSVLAQGGIRSLSKGLSWRILHILDHSLPLHSGYTFRTAAILKEQRALGWMTWHLTTPRHGPSKADVEEADGLDFHRTPVPTGALSRISPGNYLAEMLATAKRLDQMIRRDRPDILHAHSPVLNAIPTLMAGRRHAIPVVYEVRAFWEDAAVDHGSTSESALRYRATRALETFALRRANHVTTICEGLRAEIIDRGIDPSRLTVIPNAVDVEEFVSNAVPDEGLRSSLGLQGATVVGFVGSFYAYEGLDLLVAALPRMLEQRRDIRLLLVGGGPVERELRGAVASRGLENLVRFTGRVPHAEVQRYYGLIDVLSYPRRRMRLTELVTPLKPLEAMAQRKIFVASNVGGHRELVRDRETGFLCEADDAESLAAKVLEVLQFRDHWDRIRDQGLRFVREERTWRRSVARYAQAYGKAATGGDGALREQ